MSKSGVGWGTRTLDPGRLGTCASFTLGHPVAPHLLSPTCSSWAPLEEVAASSSRRLFVRALELANDLESMAGDLGDGFGRELQRRMALTAADLRAIGATLERDLLLEIGS